MTTPTPRTDAIAVVIGPDNSIRYTTPEDDRIHTAFEVVDANEFRKLERDLAARDAELAKMRDEREGNTRQFRRLQDRLAQAEADEKFWKEVSAEQRAELLKIAENPYEGNESALDYSCTHWKQRAEAAERKAEESARDAERLDWAEQNPVRAYGAIVAQWADCGRGGREIYFNFRSAIDAAIAAKVEA